MRRFACIHHLVAKFSLLLLIIKIQLLTTYYYIPIDARMIKSVSFIGYRIQKQQQQQQQRHLNRVASNILLYHCTSGSMMSPSTTTTTSLLSQSDTATSNNNDANHITSTTTTDSSTTRSKSTTIRILGLHGSGGNGQQFEKLLTEWKDYFTTLASSSGSDNNKVYDYQISTISGPVPSKDNTDGFQWWEMPPMVRSFNAESYEYFESSQQLVEDAITTTQPNLIIGHSQGAILLSSLLALQVLQNHLHQPSIGYILNGVAWPNPYNEQLESLKNLLSISSSTSTNKKIRILIIVGMKDRINPPEQAYRVAEAFKDAGYSVTLLHHPGGHSLPLSTTSLLSLSSNDTTTPLLDTIYKWIIE